MGVTVLLLIRGRFGIMQYILDGKQMQQIDKISIKEVGIPSLVLMERAALGVCEIIRKHFQNNKKIAAVSGNGNNGADAVACARILTGYGYETAVCCPGNEEKFTEELKIQLAISEKMGIKRVTLDSLTDYDVIIDGVFGIGLSRNVEGFFAETIEKINNAGKVVVAVDIPSGINAAVGRVMGAAVKADYTVTFGYLKRGLIFYPGKEYAGEIVKWECGFAPMAIEQIDEKAFIYDKKDLERIPVRKQDSNKGTYGKILVAAGSKNMSGAAYFSGKAAYRTGAGLVRILTSECNRDVIQKLLPEAVLAYREDLNEDVFENHVKWADTFVIGPGLSTDDEAAQTLYGLLERLHDTGKKVLLDADALNIISRDKRHNMLRDCVITPHIGEMCRLTGFTAFEIKENIINVAKTFASQWQCICVLKVKNCCNGWQQGICKCFRQ